MSRRSLVTLAVAVVAVLAAACAPGAAPTPAPAPNPGRTGVVNGPLGSCTVFPSDNPWNTDISTALVDANSAAYLNQIGLDGGGNLHPDFGGGGAYGIPYVTVGSDEPPVATHF